MNFEEAIQTLAQECVELLDAMENALLRLEHVPADDELINEVFRAAHTIKGSAGLFGFENVVQFAHRVESVLDCVRDGTLRIDGELIALLLACCDHLRSLSRCATRGEPDGALAPLSAELSTRLEQRLGNPAGAAPSPATADALPETSGTRSQCWHIELSFGREVLRNGMDPLAFLRYLARLGTIRHIDTRLDALPPAREVDPECCYLGFDVRFESGATRDEIARVFEFVQDDCEIRIELEGPQPAPRTQPPAPAALEPASSDPTPGARGGVPPQIEAHGADPRAREGRLIRVDADKLDQLIDLVGELVIAGAGNRLLAERSGLAGLTEQERTRRAATQRLP